MGPRFNEFDYDFMINTTISQNINESWSNAPNRCILNQKMQDRGRVGGQIKVHVQKSWSDMAPH